MRAVQIKRFTSNGSYVVPGGLKRALVFGTGAGGGGAGGYFGGGGLTDYPFGGGGGGAAVPGLCAHPCTPGETITVTVGTAGTPGAGGTVGGVVPTNGGNGGASILSGDNDWSFIGASGGKAYDTTNGAPGGLCVAGLRDFVKDYRCGGASRLFTTEEDGGADASSGVSHLTKYGHPGAAHAGRTAYAANGADASGGGADESGGGGGGAVNGFATDANGAIAANGGAGGGVTAGGVNNVGAVGGTAPAMCFGSGGGGGGSAGQRAAGAAKVGGDGSVGIAGLLVMIAFR